MSCPPANLKLAEPHMPGTDTSWDWADRLPRVGIFPPVGVESAIPGPTIEVDPRVSPGERQAGMVRPLRLSCRHLNHVACQSLTLPVAQALARDPGAYDALWCITCQSATPIGQWHWARDNQSVGT